MSKAYDDLIIWVNHRLQSIITINNIKHIDSIDTI